MQYEYKTSGTCAGKIVIELDGDIVKNVRFIGGCHGNTQGISKLVEGMKVDDVITRLQGISCGMKATSCPDQLAKALISAKSN
ncbi:MAG: TIGR03905 family TSCPD domain-containing protein [Ruminococcaceae bacterium]|nr:TIGR03905 family TSCPD domain-containing protein [Oscillospiraceae bacterium]